jgi:hypothetical protein
MGFSIGKIAKIAHSDQKLLENNLKKQKDNRQVLDFPAPAYILGGDGKKYPAINTHSSRAMNKRT